MISLKKQMLPLLLVLTVTPWLPAVSADHINITPSTPSITVEHNGEEMVIERNQTPDAAVGHDWARTDRNCPPFCVQPISAAPGVQTVSINQVIDFMRNELAVEAGAIIDARTPNWYEKGTIPGSINIPYSELNRQLGGNDLTIADAFSKFDVTEKEDGTWDFSNAKALILWCNGWWCGQSPAAIQGLLNEGYPADKLYYFRGGMQNWVLYGLTITNK